MRKTLGGDRLGGGKRMQVDTQSYGRSTHNLSYLFRTTMSPGTLVPFMKEVVLPGDTFTIRLNLDGKTHPTVGPLFGGFKVECDVFQIPFRLYNGQLHNNKMGIGLNMQAVKFPVMTLYVDPTAPVPTDNPDNAQVNPSSLLAYLGMRGIGMVDPDEPALVGRDLNAMGVLAYYDILKNYYANKQETQAYIIHQERLGLVLISNVQIDGANIDNVFPNTNYLNINGSNPNNVEIPFPGANPILNQIIFYTDRGQIPADVALTNVDIVGAQVNAQWNLARTGALTIYYWGYISNGALPINEPHLFGFDLSNIDDMREYILTWTQNSAPFNINTNAGGMAPYATILDWVNGFSPYMNSQEGLAVKTYMSDMYNNWLNEEWIDGVNGINEITAVDVSGGSLKIESLILAKKVYNMLNDIAVSGGTYDDYLDVVYDEERFTRAETPIFEGGLIQELVFQEVISNAEGVTSGGTQGQPLGTLGGRGVMARDSVKGGNMTIKISEPGYLMGIVHITPRIDYSQGNDWDMTLQSIDDLHKPALDQIGFQDLIEEGMAWWTTDKQLGVPGWRQKSAGKQPAWLNYMTNTNKVRGNFAIPDNEMFMVLNRRYERIGFSSIKDLTTYVDPAKFNNAFAQTSLDAQNFWIQIAVDIEARRKMSAKIMPNM